MNLTNTEKKVLQKYYIESIKSHAANLKDIIQNGKAEALITQLECIVDDCKRVKTLETTRREEVLEAQREPEQQALTDHRHGAGL